MYLAPWCLFYPALVTAYTKLPNWKDSFISLSGGYQIEDHISTGNEVISATQFGKLPSVEESNSNILNDTPAEIIQDNLEIDSSADSTAIESQIQVSEKKENIKTALGLNITSTQMGATTPISKISNSSAPDTPKSTKKEQTLTADTNQALARGLNQTAATTLKRIFNEEAMDELMPLDQAIVHSIAHSGGIDKVRKFYTSIILVGGGISFIPDIDELLKERLLIHTKKMYKGNDFVERIETFPSPRDLDPRVLVWKGGAVLSRLDIADELWISKHEWNELGTRTLKDRALFLW
ncbi:hypothetical protein BB561_002788 [Smittium simulii]|uniref:Uncharacterized protein n=1 Tax=Smittium simulii TaxID=133385 RepID=A0A2T9YP41_9FUNG|nr:hypothetical protein BB561_002788 [Smittium simulii]